MASYSPPDFYVSLTIEDALFENISGTAFSITASSPNAKSKGMIIIPQIQNDEDSPSREAWLWVNRLSKFCNGDVLKIKLIEVSDPMLIGESYDYLNKYVGTVLAATISRKSEN